MGKALGAEAVSRLSTAAEIATTVGSSCLDLRSAEPNSSLAGRPGPTTNAAPHGLTMGLAAPGGPIHPAPVHLPQGLRLVAFGS